MEDKGGREFYNVAGWLLGGFTTLLVVAILIVAFTFEPAPEELEVAAPVVTAPEVVVETVQVPAQEVTLAFANSVKDPGSLNCSQTYPVVRTSTTEFTPELALTELFAGPTQTEASQGYFTGLPAGAQFNSVTVNPSGNIVYVDVNGVFANLEDECLRDRIYAQIEQTMIAQTGLLNVFITVNGAVDPSLQP